MPAETRTRGSAVAGSDGLVATGDGILPLVLLGLTATTGVVDAVSYLALGHVFTANMTGNVVLLGFAAAGAQGLSIGRSGAALAAFMAGAVIGGRLTLREPPGRPEPGRGATTPRPSRRWAAATFALEAALLAGAALTAALGDAGAFSNHGTQLYIVIVLTGLAMGVRIAAVRRLSIPDLTTTVLTMTLAGLAADSALAGGSNQGWARRTASVVTLFAGAAVGAWLLRHSIALPLAVGSAVSGACALAIAACANPD